MCAEINAKNLIEIIKLFREQFLPLILDSQTCERAFRQFRSMGTMQFTKINFSLLELIHMIGRIEVQNDIAYCKLNVDGISFPHKCTEKTVIYDLPTDEQIDATIKEAKLEAIRTGNIFGMTENMTENLRNVDQLLEFTFQSRLELDEDDLEEYYDDQMEDKYDSLHEPEIDPENIAKDIEFNMIKPEELDEDSPLLYVVDDKGVIQLMNKSTYLWMITEPSMKISNDRIRRFQARPTFERNVSD